MFAHVGLPTFSTTVDPTRTHIQCCSLWGRFLISRKRGKKRWESGFSISVASDRIFEMARLLWATQLRLLCSQFCASSFVAAICSRRMFFLALRSFTRAFSALARAVVGPGAGLGSCPMVGLVVVDVFGASHTRSRGHSCVLEGQGFMEWRWRWMVWVLILSAVVFPLITLSLRVHLVAGAILNWGDRQPTVVAAHLRFFFPRFLFPLWVRFIFLGDLLAQEESGCRDFTALVGVGEEFCGVMVWGLLVFLLLLLGFRFPRFLLPLWVRFLGRVAGCTFISLTTLVGVIGRLRLLGTGAGASLRTILTASSRTLLAGCSESGC